MMEDRMLRIEEKFDTLNEVVIRMDEQLKQTHALLVKHDAAGAKALAKANKLEDRLEELEDMWQVPMKWLLLLAKIGTAVAAIFGAYKLFNGE